MFGLVRKGLRLVSSGQVQQGIGLQSPHLPGGVVRIGRFLYIFTGGWITAAWYTGYVNARTEPGSGPKLIIAGKKVSTVDRPDKTPNFANSLFQSVTGQKNGGDGTKGGAGIVGGVAGVISGIGAITGTAGGKGPPGNSYYPGPVGRTDQGVDFAGTGPVRAIADGTVVYAGLWHGWPGTDGIVYQTKYGKIFVMEHFQRSVNPATGKPYKIGDTIKQGDTIGQALRGYPYIESGFANAAGTGPLTPYGGNADGTAMPGGLAFRKLLGYN